METLVEELKETLDINTKPYLTIAEVSKMLHVSENTINKWREQGLLMIDMGERTKRFSRKTLDDFLSKYER